MNLYAKARHWPWSLICQRQWKYDALMTQTCPASKAVNLVLGKFTWSRDGLLRR
jgi:hypothetical protein